MTCQKSSSIAAAPPRALNPGTAQGSCTAGLRAAAIFQRLDTRIAHYESSFGYPTLLRTIGGLDLDRVNGHVDFYRSIIRKGEWPNEARPGSLDEFLVDFESSCIAYIEVAFLALHHLGLGKYPAELIYRLAAGSEALRGQFGKQSPTGLDARLAELDDELTTALQAIFGDKWEQSAWVLCMPDGPTLTAEAALLEDFFELRLHFKTVPTEAKITAADPASAQLAMAFLRHHCRWSLGRLAQCYAQFDDDLLPRRIKDARDRRLQQVQIRAQTAGEIVKQCSSETAAHLLDTAKAVAILNGLNLCVEPVFSFKGSAGLVHGIIFERESLLPTELLERETIVQTKWALLAHANKQAKEKKYA